MATFTGKVSGPDDPKGLDVTIKDTAGTEGCPPRRSIDDMDTLGPASGQLAGERHAAQPQHRRFRAVPEC